MMDMNMGTSALLMCLALMACAIVLLLCIIRWNRVLQDLKERIGVCEYYVKLARVVDDHMGSEQLQKANEETERAVERGRHIMDYNMRIRKPLEMIIESTKQISDTGIDDATRSLLSQQVSNESKRLMDMVERILLLARVESDNLIYEEADMVLESIVPVIYDEFKEEDGSSYRVVESRGACRLGLIPGRPGMHINCDAKHIRTALLEILKNAFKFSEEGDILIGWFYRLSSNEVEIFIEDNGIGIGQEEQNHVFDLFYRMDESKLGAGVGLFIARALVEKMGGRMVLKSRLGVGTRVSVLFPLSSIDGK